MCYIFLWGGIDDKCEGHLGCEWWPYGFEEFKNLHLDHERHTTTSISPIWANMRLHCKSQYIIRFLFRWEFQKPPSSSLSLFNYFHYHQENLILWSPYKRLNLDAFVLIIYGRECLQRICFHFVILIFPFLCLYFFSWSLIFETNFWSLGMWGGICRNTRKIKSVFMLIIS